MSNGETSQKEGGPEKKKEGGRWAQKSRELCENHNKINVIKGAMQIEIMQDKEMEILTVIGHLELFVRENRKMPGIL